MHQRPQSRLGIRLTSPDYPTAPIPTKGLPPGIPYIVGNEAAERFSFYGMRAILVVFMTQYLLSAGGHAQPMPESEAKFYYHLFNAGVYFFPILGALLADILWGKYNTIIGLSLVYCLGHAALAWDETRLGLFLGLGLISIGSGGIKSCVSAHVGDQFGRHNQHRLSEVFSWFYLAINLGAAGSTLVTPTLLRLYGPGLAFAVPGLLMALATLFFFLGRTKFAHIPPGGRNFLKELVRGDGLTAVARLIPLYLFVAMFWALFDQSGSAWVLQAERMDRHWLGWEWDAAQFQAINPLLILVLVPTFTYGIYPLCQKYFDFTPLRRIGTGLFLAALSFSLPAVAEQIIQGGGRPGIEWQLIAYVLLTSAEVLVSITCLEFSYTQAPPTMKSLVMGLYLLSVSLGNVFTAGVNQALRLTGADQPGGLLAGAGYYWFFVICMLVMAALFVPTAYFYRGRTYLQDGADSGLAGEADSPAS
ncbi:MAG: POT family MFS transporter [Thermogutta sp.]|nr:POT family MFS transporter [Thermogutta sp.]